jgi:hypothetical protein
MENQPTSYFLAAVTVVINLRLNSGHFFAGKITMFHLTGSPSSCMILSALVVGDGPGRKM